MIKGRPAARAWLVVALVACVACAIAAVLVRGGDAPRGSRSGAEGSTGPSAPITDTAASQAPTVSPSPMSQSPTATAAAPGASTDPVPSDGTPAHAVLRIPQIGLDGLEVVPYVGWTDDALGTAIQNDGLGAAPHGPRGGTGPGGVGNYQVTAHRNTAGGPFFDLPLLAVGTMVHVDAGGTRYSYRVTETRERSFRSESSLAEQRAAVPGQPGAKGVRAMITLSTCATQEDHAAGNFWSDQFDNPEHRIDKIGVLVSTTSLS